MIILKDAFTFTNGAVFPDTLSVNSTTPTSVDGTEFKKAMIDDEWGARYALLDWANKADAAWVPDDVTEAPGTSQFVESLIRGFGIGPGAGVIYWKNDDPVTNGDRVLLLDGSGILRANYAELDAVVYVGDGDNPSASTFYHADDAAGTIRNTAGIYLILPDTRGYTLRGLDVAGVVDEDAGRDLGSIQLDQFQGHFHENFGLNNVFQGGANLAAPTISPDNIALHPNNIRQPTEGSNGVPRRGNETRMVNVATTYGITY